MAITLLSSSNIVKVVKYNRSFVFLLYNNFHRPLILHRCLTFQKHDCRAKAQLTEGKSSQKTIVQDWGDILSRWYNQYQDFVGITEILNAQNRVTQLTTDLLEAQSKRRKLQSEVESIHQQLLSVHQKTTKAELYSEDHFSLFESARQLNASLKFSQEQFSICEGEERTIFTHLSTAIKFCHEKERTQAEQSKYWSILLSLVSATLASLITSVNNWVRIREMKDHSTRLHRDALNKYDNLESKIMCSISDIVNENKDLPSESAQTDLFPDEKSEKLKLIIKEELHNYFNKEKLLPFSGTCTLEMEKSETFDLKTISVVGISSAVVGGLVAAAYYTFPGS